MRLAMVFQWLRAALASPWYRQPALCQALAITIVQGLWVTRQLVFHQDRWSFVAFIVLAACEIALPHIAQTKTAIPWHPRHVAERYSLFTLIVFGESVIAAGNAMIDAIYATDDLQPLIIISIGALIIAAGLWWVYFARYQKTDIHTFKRARVFSYVHYALLVSIGAFSAGLECLIDEVEGQGLLTGFRADATVSVPVAFFFLIVWWFFLRKNLRPFHQALGWLGLIVVCLSPLAPEAIIVTAAGVMITVIAVELARVQETADESASEPPVTGDHASASSHHHS
jgi:low temperature requirement protein LtrA